VRGLRASLFPKGKEMKTTINSKTAMARRSGAASTKTALALAMLVALSGIGAINANAANSGTGTFATIAHPTVLRQGDAVLGALPMAQPIHIEVALKMRDRDGLEAFIANNAKNQAHGVAAQLMTPAQFLANHAPTQAQADAVASYLTHSGFTNVVIAPNRLLVSADGTARTARDAFMTTFAQVQTHDGRIAFANTGEVRIPAALQDNILSVVGLQTVHQAHTFARPLGGAHTETVTGHFPTEFSSIYGGGSSVVASGITVGIVTEGSLTQTKADLATFATNQGLPAVLTSTVATHGSSSDTAGTGEWDLDSQDVVGMAGGQVHRIIFYNIPTLANSDLVADFNTIVTANQAKIINVSLGECETGAQGDGSAAAADAIFATAVAQGQTFSISTGDSGADECGNSTNTPSWPADSQYVVAAAGTRLTATTTVWGAESIWKYSGGSASTFEPMPSWQTAFGVSGTKRVVADIAFDADPNSGSIIVVNGSLAQYGGTSLSAPIFAGLWARVLQTYPTIGFAGPVIYALPAGAFHDVTTGKNSGGEVSIGYSGAVGYDFASGRGSMILSTVLTDSAGLGNKPPVANFNFSAINLNVTFTDTSTDSDGTVVSHSWKFGDGATSTATNPSHAYATAGTYTVKETVKDRVGAMASKSRFVTVTGP